MNKLKEYNVLIDVDKSNNQFKKSHISQIKDNLPKPKCIFQINSHHIFQSKSQNQLISSCNSYQESNSKQFKNWLRKQFKQDLMITLRPMKKWLRERYNKLFNKRLLKFLKNLLNSRQIHQIDPLLVNLQARQQEADWVQQPRNQLIQDFEYEYF